MNLPTTGRRLVVPVALVLALLAAFCLSLMVGRQGLNPIEVVRALFIGGPDDPVVIVRGLRLQRSAVALVVGLALGAAGALMQALTRNPLADPGLFGINAGAAAAVVTAFSFFGIVDRTAQMWVALVGAAVAAVAVYAVGTRGAASATPARLALAGTALSAVLLSYINWVSLQDQESFDALRFWVVGSVVNRGWEALAAALPFLVVGAVVALVLTPSLNALALGEDTGRALGLGVGRVRIVTAVAVVLLAGAATAVAGPIGFVGLTVPHIARSLVGPDQRFVVPLSMMLAAILLLVADVLGRIVTSGAEVQAGVMMAILGAPAFIVLVRRRRLVAL